MSTEAETTTNWLDELVRDPLLEKFERLRFPGIWSYKIQQEIVQMIAMQRDLHCTPDAYDAAENQKWSLLQFHLEKFRAKVAKAVRVEIPF